ncbi:PREDICTED: eosinophil peroxidase-like, partial [Priapulus caudatus]|uniref:Eosinophil peroxidase-like n=1 Tax=Priapulus caudatus TaxID=37621 RepID=A0ABM1F7D3_PRICU
MSVSQECQPVSIPRDDSFFPATTADGSPHCMAFARSSPITDKKFGPRQQMNQITSFIDASNVYGSTMCRKEQLREGRGGRMRMQPNGNRKPLLPPLADDEEDCAATPKSRCFMAGDVRANEQPLLATTHLIWVRQHNRLVGELAGLNPHWSDEMLYE